MSRIETDYANLLLLAISLEKMARDEIAKLSNERPNDPYTIESNKKQSDLLSILADGFAKIAAALEEYSKDPRPFFAGKVKEIRDWVGAQLKAWWEANEAEARDLCVRLPIFIASIGALNLVPTCTLRQRRSAHPSAVRTRSLPSKQHGSAMNLDLTDEETAALTKELHDIVENDRYPFSPRIRTLRGITCTLRPEPVREPPPPPKVYAPPRFIPGRRRRG
jgi:hypothetical protein